MPLIVLVGILMIIAWAFLWLWLKIVSGLIHIIPIVALVFIIWGMLQRGKRALQGDRR